MARSKNNPVLKGLSGQIGRNIVVKTYSDGRQVVANMPSRRSKTSEKQRDNETKFGSSNHYAQMQMSDPAVAAQYNRRAKGTSANGYNLAVKDFMHAPRIESVEAADYAGKRGSIIRVRATDDFKVVTVTVTITVGIKVIETGEATPRGRRGLWRYATTAVNARWKGSVVTAVAQDMAGNRATAYISCSDGVVKWI